MSTTSHTLPVRKTIYFGSEESLYIEKRAEELDVSTSELVRMALQIMREKELEEDLRAGAIANAEQDLQIAEEDMQSYWEVVTQYPHGC